MLRIPVRYGMGFGLAGPSMPMLNEQTCFWGGYGGSLVMIDMERRMTVAYAMNRLQGTTTGDMRAGMLAAFTMQGLMS